MIKEPTYPSNDAKCKEPGKSEIVFPLALSASRRTDIPAFQAPQFLQQLKEGHILYQSPFNQKPRAISLKKLRAIVLWTKNATPLLPLLPALDPYIYYFQYTLNDYEKDGLEPGVPPLDERIRTFQELSRRIGKERVIWRFDPLVLTAKLTPERLLEKIKGVGDQLYSYTERLVFSFADIGIYRKVRQRMAGAGIDYLEFTSSLMSELAKGIAELNSSWRLKLATCAEWIELNSLGIEHNHCIDVELLNRLAGQAKSPPVTQSSSDTKVKDKGQRSDCQCFPSIDIGQYNTCRHSCLYCYACP